jgi:outer membrane lipoprotein carrier protein
MTLTLKKTLNGAALAVALALTVPLAARADAVETLRGFVQTVQSGRAAFTQVATSPDGAKKKTSTGEFEFQRPNRFRFDYAKPYAQQIVADGQKVWLYDPDLGQVTVRAFDQALGATPAALLSGGNLERDFSLQAEADQGGLQWVLAQPKAKEGQIRQLRVGFKGRELAVIELTDALGQRSRLDFDHFESNVRIVPERFRFQAPAGTDVLQQ